MISPVSRLILVISLVLLVYWFRYTCLFMLRSRSADNVRGENGMGFGEIQPNASLAVLETALERDYYLPLLEGREVILLEYPGYGSRPGAPSQPALVADAVDALGDADRVVGAHADDLTRSVRERDEGKRLLGVVAPLHHEQVAEVERHRAQAHDHVPWARNRVGALDRGQGVEAERLLDLEGFHVVG